MIGTTGGKSRLAGSNLILFFRDPLSPHHLGVLRPPTSPLLYAITKGLFLLRLRQLSRTSGMCRSHFVRDQFHRSGNRQFDFVYLTLALFCFVLVLSLIRYAHELFAISPDTSHADVLFPVASLLLFLQMT